MLGEDCLFGGFDHRGQRAAPTRCGERDRRAEGERGKGRVRFLGQDARMWCRRLPLEPMGCVAETACSEASTIAARGPLLQGVGRGIEAQGERGQSVLSAFGLPPSAFRLPPSAFRLPPSVFRLPTIDAPTHRRTDAQTHRPPPHRLPHLQLPNHLAVVVGAEDRRAGDQRVGAGGNHLGRIVRLDPAVDFQSNRQA